MTSSAADIVPAPALQAPRNLSIWNHLFRTPHTLGWLEVDGVSTRYLEAGRRTGRSF